MRANARLREKAKRLKREEKKTPLRLMNKGATMKSPERIGYDEIQGIRISTVKLPFMHIGGIYETMIFGGNEEINEYQERYNTEIGAIEGHKNAVQKVKDYLGIIVKLE